MGRCQLEAPGGCWGSPMRGGMVCLRRSGHSSPHAASQDTPTTRPDSPTRVAARGTGRTTLPCTTPVNMYCLSRSLCRALSRSLSRSLSLSMSYIYVGRSRYDYLRVPEHLTPGDYVLGFRWDCEASVRLSLSTCPSIRLSMCVCVCVRARACVCVCLTRLRLQAQIWQSCADVKITAPSA